MKFIVGDNVIGLTGNYKGQEGAITKILRKQGKVVVEGLNKKVRHVKARNGQPGDRVEFFAPVDASNVAIKDPKTGKPSRIGFKLDANGNKTRIAKKSGSELSSSKK